MSRCAQASIEHRGEAHKSIARNDFASPGSPQRWSYTDYIIGLDSQKSVEIRFGIFISCCCSICMTSDQIYQRSLDNSPLRNWDWSDQRSFYSQKIKKRQHFFQEASVCKYVVSQFHKPPENPSKSG